MKMLTPHEMHTITGGETIDPQLIEDVLDQLQHQADADWDAYVRMMMAQYAQ